jgi:UDP-N-acetylglucosamine 2-epimerase
MILVSYGTRPEIIKLFPVIKELQKRNIEFKTLFTGQHLELMEQLSHLVPRPDFYIKNSFKKGQSLTSLTSSLVREAGKILDENSFDCVVVQGDTQSTFSVGLSAFYNKTKIAHVEAGLRTYNLHSPFPEEANRTMLSKIVDFNFTPTKEASDNLIKEEIKNIYQVGNTVIDACKYFDLPIAYEDFVLVTIHRRENFEKIKKVFREINEVAKQLKNLNFIFPMHLNPNIQKHKELLTEENIKVVEPLEYEKFLKLISKCKFIITDSGGIQEEACHFRKKVLVVRDNTERPEGVAAGLSKVVGSELVKNYLWAYEAHAYDGKQIYGDGTSAKKIVDTLVEKLK